MRKILKILLIIIVTVACIILGIFTRKNSAIDVTSIDVSSGKGLSYILKTNKDKLVMIDGGAEEDTENVVSVINENGGCVEKWFITIADPDNFGVLKKILEQNLVTVNSIYISFNSADWYEKIMPTEDYAELAEFLDLIYSDEIIKTVYNVPQDYEVLVDNLYFKVLNVKNPDLKDEYAFYNQSMVISVNNTFKSMIFMGSIAQSGAKEMRDAHQDQIDCDAVQISNNGIQSVESNIYVEMSPEYVFMPATDNVANDMEYINVLTNSIDVDGVIYPAGNIKIW